MKIFKIIYYIFLGCVVAIAVLLIVSIFPITGNFKVMVVQSGSMEPAIKMGAIVTVKPVAEYKVGDVITFRDPDGSKNTITHRLYEIKTDDSGIRYITKGDANNSPDREGFEKKYIIGKVLFSAPYVGYAVDAAKKPIGFALIIIVPALIIICDEARKIFCEVKKIKKARVNESTNPSLKDEEKG